MGQFGFQTLKPFLDREREGNNRVHVPASQPETVTLFPSWSTGVQR